MFMEDIHCRYNIKFTVTVKHEKKQLKFVYKLTTNNYLDNLSL